MFRRILIILFGLVAIGGIVFAGFYFGKSTDNNVATDSDNKNEIVNGDNIVNGDIQGDTIILYDYKLDADMTCESDTGTTNTLFKVSVSDWRNAVYSEDTSLYVGLTLLSNDKYYDSWGYDYNLSDSEGSQDSTPDILTIDIPKDLGINLPAGDYCFCIVVKYMQRFAEYDNTSAYHAVERATYYMNYNFTVDDTTKNLINLVVSVKATDDNGVVVTPGSDVEIGEGTDISGEIENDGSIEVPGTIPDGDLIVDSGSAIIP